MDFEEMCKQTEQNQRRGKSCWRYFSSSSEGLFLAREWEATFHWLFTWKTFLIALGIITGVKHNLETLGGFS